MHWDVAIHILQYLKGTPSKGLFYPSTCDYKLTTYSNADWGTCANRRKSLTEYCVFLGASLVSWKAKKQNTVSKSSAEAEYRVLRTTVTELQWLTYLCHNFCILVLTPIPLLCNNQATLHITENLNFFERTKHLEIDCHIIRNKYKEGFLVLHHVHSILQLVDLFTKSLGQAQFRFLLAKLGMLDLFHSPTWGDVEVKKAPGHDSLYSWLVGALKFVLFVHLAMALYIPGRSSLLVN